MAYSKDFLGFLIDVAHSWAYEDSSFMLEIMPFTYFLVMTS